MISKRDENRQNWEEQRPKKSSLCGYVACFFFMCWDSMSKAEKTICVICPYSMLSGGWRDVRAKQWSEKKKSMSMGYFIIETSINNLQCAGISLPFNRRGFLWLVGGSVNKFHRVCRVPCVWIARLRRVTQSIHLHCCLNQRRGGGGGERWRKEKVPSHPKNYILLILTF